MASPDGKSNIVLQGLGVQFLTAARSSLSMSGAGASQELQQLAQDAAEPLLGLGMCLYTAIGWSRWAFPRYAGPPLHISSTPGHLQQCRYVAGKVVAGSILNSSSLALTGGIGIMRLCLGELGVTHNSKSCHASCSAYKSMRYEG